MKNSPTPLVFRLVLLSAAALPAAFAADAPNRAIPAADAAKVAKVDAALPAAAPAKPAHPRKLLVTARTEGYYHESIPLGLHAIQALGEKTGAYSVEIDNETTAFTKENLARFDGILFLNTTQLRLEDPAKREAILGFVREEGRGLVGIHAASDNFYIWPDGQALIGGCFHSHPWLKDDLVAVRIDDPGHPVVASFGKTGFWIQDEIYQIVGPYDRQKQRVLLSLDMTKAENKRPPDKLVRPENDLPIAWVKQQGKGRVFYSSLGHNDHIYWDTRVLQHYLAGIQFALGDFDVPTKPFPADGAPIPAFAPAAPLASTDGVLDAILATPDQSENPAYRSLEQLLRSQSEAERHALTGKLAADAAQKTVHANGRAMLSQLFGQFGGDAAVPVLTDWAGQGTDNAIRALGRIGSPAAVNALAALLSKADAPKISIVNALELSGSPDAVKAIAAAMKAPDVETTVAARDALARIDSPAAFAALVEGGQVTSGRDYDWAVLKAAWSSHSADLKKRLAAVQSLLDTSKDFTIRVGAANTLVQLGSEPALQSTVALLKDEALGLRLATAWVTQVSAVNATSAVRALAADFGSLPTSVQVAVLAVAEQQGTPVLLPLANAGLASKTEDVRKAAFASLASCAAELKDVAPAIAALEKPEDKTSAIAALSRARATGLDATIREKVTSEKTTGLLAAWLIIASNRVDSSLMPQVLKNLSSENTEIRQAAFKALKPLVRGEDLDLLLGLRSQLKTPAERKAWQDATVAAIAFRSDTDALVQLLGKELKTASTAERSAFVSALININTQDSLSLVATELATPDVEKRKELIRTLSGLKKSQAVPLLLSAAEKANESNERILALRGAIDTLLGLGELGDREKFSAYKRAWAIAERPEERNAIIKMSDWLWGAESRKWGADLRAKNSPFKS